MNESKAPKIKSKKEYPAYTVNESISFIEKFKAYQPGQPISYDVAAKAIKVSATTKSFRYYLSSARQYGLISTSNGDKINLLESAYRLIRPTEDEGILNMVRLECFKSPKLYSELINYYNGKSMPDISKLENYLMNSHGIAPNVAKKAAQTFISSANEVGAVINGILSIDYINNHPDQYIDTDEQNIEGSPADIVDTIADTAQLNKLPSKDGLNPPLSIPFFDGRRAILYMPKEATKEDAEYVRDMIYTMFKKVYGVENDKK